MFQAVLKQNSYPQRKGSYSWKEASAIIPSLFKIYITANNLKVQFYSSILHFVIFAVFDHFCKILFREQFQNHEIVKLNICRVWDSLFPNIWSKHEIGPRISHISTCSHYIRVPVTYLITFTLINNRNINIKWDFRFLFLLKSRN